MASSSACERIVVLVDMDCFYVQVEERDHPAIRGRPAAVVQYNTHRGGGIIAVNYEARACGVKRGIRGTDALEACPEIQLVRVPMLRNKANLAKYRNAGKEVLDVLCRFSDVVERASIDEAYLDVTHVVELIIQRGYHSKNTPRVSSKDDSKIDFDETNNSKGLVSDQRSESHSTFKVKAESAKSKIEGIGSLGSLIPSMEDLPTTWIELPLAESEKEIYDLGDEKQRRKYELETTALSDWTPGVAGDAIEAEEQDATEGGTGLNEHAEVSSVPENVGTSEAEDGASEDGAPASVKEKTKEVKEAERVRGLSKWLASVRESSSNFDDDAQDCNGFSYEALTLDASTSHSTSANGAGGVATSNASDALRLAVAARLCEEIRATVLKETGFKCSAGIAHNKVLAKLVCGLHKPNQQTVLPADGVDELWRRTPVRKVRNLGGKLGHSLTTDLGCDTMADLSALPFSVLSSRYDDKTAKWLYELGKGRDSEAVVARQLPKSVGCSKNFLGPESLYTRAKVQEWTRALAEELAERLVEDQNLNKRVARTLTVSYRLGDKPGQNSNYGPNSGTRSCPLPSYAAERIADVTMTLLNSCNTAKQADKWSPALLNIGMSAGKFDDFLSSGMPSISDMFKRAELRQARSDAGTFTGPETGDSQCQEDDQRQVNNELSTHSFSEQEIDTGQRAECQQGINKFLIAKQMSSDCNTSDYSIHDDGTRSSPCTSTRRGTKLHQSDAEDSKDNSGSSFFKNYFMRKKVSGSAIEETCTDPTSTIRLAKSDEDSRSALDLLVEELDTSDEDLPLSRDLKTKQILRSSPVAEDGEESVYDASTDEDESPTKNSAERHDTRGTCREHKTSFCKELNSAVVETETDTRSTNVDPALELNSSNNDSKGIDAVSVTELFPNLDEVDESLLPHLPQDLRKAVNLALVRHKAEKAGREALNTTGIARFMTKCDSREERQQENGLRSLKKSATNQENYINGFEKGLHTGILTNVRGSNATPDKSPTATQELGATASPGPSSVRTINVSMSTQTMKRGEGSSSLNWERLPTNGYYSREGQQAYENLPQDPSSPNEDCSTKCELCGAKISYSEVAEHADYHVALKLQEQLQAGAYPAGGSRKLETSAPSRKTAKRKVLRQSLPESKKYKTIDSFFNK